MIGTPRMRMSDVFAIFCSRGPNTVTQNLQADYAYYIRCFKRVLTDRRLVLRSGKIFMADVIFDSRIVEVWSLVVWIKATTGTSPAT